MNYKNFLTETEMETLKNDEVFPLVRELAFKHNLEVFAYESYVSVRNKYYLCNESGINVGSVQFNVEKQFEFFTPHHGKSRGRNFEDRHTFRTNKLSALMRTIKENGLVSSGIYGTNFLYNLTSIESSIHHNNRFSHVDRNTLSDSEFVKILSVVLGENENSEILNIEKCKLLLDKYHERDKIIASNLQTLKEFVTKPFFAISSDLFHHTLVGAFRIKESADFKDFNGTNIMHNLEVVTPMARYKKVEDSPIVSLYPMFKTFFENSKLRIVNGIQPTSDNNHIPELDLFVTSGSQDKYTSSWMFTPC